jgi:hypothetical protein
MKTIYLGCFLLLLIGFSCKNANNQEKKIIIEDSLNVGKSEVKPFSSLEFLLKTYGESLDTSLQLVLVYDIPRDTSLLISLKQINGEHRISIKYVQPYYGRILPGDEVERSKLDNYRVKYDNMSYDFRKSQVQKIYSGLDNIDFWNLDKESKEKEEKVCDGERIFLRVKKGNKINEIRRTMLNRKKSVNKFILQFLTDLGLERFFLRTGEWESENKNS